MFGNWGENERAGQVLATPHPGANQRATVAECATMADDSQYTDSTNPRNTGQTENIAWRDDTCWLRLGDVVDSLKRKVEAAYHACDDAAAADAHDDLTSAEWRLRRAERGRE